MAKSMLDDSLREMHAPYVQPTEDGGAIDWNNMRELQDELTRWANSRFPTRTDHAALTKLVMEEVPEMLQHKKEHGTEEIGEELADAFILLMDLATLWEVDLPVAIHHKMIKNYQRVWEVDPRTGIAQHIDGVLIEEDDPVPMWSGFKQEINCIGCFSASHVQKLTSEELIHSRGDDYRCTKCTITFDSTIPF